MTDRSSARLATPSGCALAAAIFLVAGAVLAQTNAPQSKEAEAKASTVAAPSEGTKASETPPPALTSASQDQATLGPDEAQLEEPEELVLPALPVGDATQNLLAWQRSGEVASPTPRPIAGNVASRSYERYLKSFDYPIPERLGSTVTTSTSGTSGSSLSGSR